MEFHRAITAAELGEGRSVAVEIAGRSVLLVKSDDKVYVLDNLCPHAGSRLDKGRIVKGAVACPLHGARFDLATGQCRTPQIGDVGPIVTHTVRLVDNQIEVALTAQPAVEPQY